MENQLIPEQLIGNEMNASASRVCTDIGEAALFYANAKTKLLAVNNWSQICNSGITTFQLTDRLGADTVELLEGSLIKIDIPGPATSIGKGFDWVRIEKIAQQSDTELNEWFGFRVRPCQHPSSKELATAHFFTDQSTATFLVRRVGNSVFAEVHGRNETPNNEDVSMLDHIRNTMVGTASKIGLSFPQWQLLVDGIVKDEEIS